MKQIKYILIFLSFSFSCLTASELTISSYNCGALSDHYDYLRAVSMQKLMQERYNAEPEKMALNEKIQQTALKMVFSKTHQEKLAAEQEWEQKGYQQIFEPLFSSPKEENSPNTLWNQKVEQTISSYKIRPVSIYDEEVKQLLNEHLENLAQSTPEGTLQALDQVRAKMAKQIFTYHLKHDIICLQEADYLNTSQFPSHYEVLFSDTSHSVNGIAFNKNRFELTEMLGSIEERAFAVKLLDKETNKTILVASGHLTGCNPYRIEADPAGSTDSAKGDHELQALVDLFDVQEADLKLIGMDSNVTSLHPRLQIIKDAGYLLDCENYLEPTCTNPYQVLNTRIDWIVAKPLGKTTTSVINIPVFSVGLNQLQTNMSDHKPIAAKIIY